jgi:hypothetical protein
MLLQDSDESRMPCLMRRNDTNHGFPDSHQRRWKTANFDYPTGHQSRGTNAYELDFSLSLRFRLSRHGSVPAALLLARSTPSRELDSCRAATLHLWRPSFSPTLVLGAANAKKLAGDRKLLGAVHPENVARCAHRQSRISSLLIQVATWLKAELIESIRTINLHLHSPHRLALTLLWSTFTESFVITTIAVGY